MQYLTKRLLMTVPTLLGVLVITFVFVRLIPGDPVVLLLGDAATPEAVADMRRQMGLDEPIIIQFGLYLMDVVRGDIGTSIRTNRDVLSEVLRVLPYTLQLTFAAVAVGTLVGIPIGIWTAVRHNTVTDYVANAVAMLAMATPAFWFGILLMLLFSYYLNWFPAIGVGRGDGLWTTLSHLFLPALAVGLRNAAGVARMTRAYVLEVLYQDYVRTARAKGVAEHVVVLRHVLKNAMIPIVTYIGLDMGVLLGGTVVTEVLFSRPGLGKLMVDAIYARDYAQMQACILFWAFAYMVINIIVDLTYSRLDPRVRYE